MGVTIRIAHATRRFFHSFNMFVTLVFLQLMIKGGLLFYAIGKVGIKERKDA